MTVTGIRPRPGHAPEGVARLLAGVRADGRAVSHDEHLAIYGGLPLRADLIELAAASGLLGRGGAGFPTAQKLRAVAGQRGRPVVVVNGMEGEPASRKDGALLTRLPHLVLDGAAAAAHALGAGEVVVATARGARASRVCLETALRERHDRLRWRLAAVPDGFVTGEETALLAGLAGAAARPTVKPPFPFERGVGGAPTLVQNAETLAQLALIARFGPAWFRSLGSEREPGTALVTLSGAVRRPGVYEIELGTPVSGLLAEGGGPTEPLQAVLVGGYFGAWTRDLAHRLEAAGGLGAGVVIAFPTAACAIGESARVAAYLAAESAGQCGPCVHGLRALAGGLAELHAGTGDGRERLTRWVEQVAGRGACRHPDGVARFVASALSTFELEVANHIRNGGCGRLDRGILPVAHRRG